MGAEPSQKGGDDDMEKKYRRVDVAIFFHIIIVLFDDGYQIRLWIMSFF